MEAFLVDDAVLKSQIDNAPPGPVGPEQLSRWCVAHGQPLEVVSWEDGNFMLVADAFEGLPSAVESLYGCERIHARAVESSSVAIGYLPAESARAALQDWPEPDFDSPAPEVIAAREELEAWLRRAAEASKAIVVQWN